MNYPRVPTVPLGIKKLDEVWRDQANSHGDRIRGTSGGSRVDLTNDCSHLGGTYQIVCKEVPKPRNAESKRRGTKFERRLREANERIVSWRPSSSVVTTRHGGSSRQREHCTVE